MTAKDDLRDALGEVLTVAFAPSTGVLSLGQRKMNIARAASGLADHIDALVEEHVRAHAEEAPHLYADGSQG